MARLVAKEGSKGGLVSWFALSPRKGEGRPGELARLVAKGCYVRTTSSGLDPFVRILDGKGREEERKRTLAEA
jgi:hypothetical protein